MLVLLFYFNLTHCQCLNYIFIFTIRIDKFLTYILFLALALIMLLYIFYFKYKH